MRNNFWESTQQTDRQVFGLDSHYKSTIYRYKLLFFIIFIYVFRFPLWVLTTVSNNNHGSVGYVVIANKGTKELLIEALNIIFDDLLSNITGISEDYFYDWKNRVRYIIKFYFYLFTLLLDLLYD